MLDAGRAGAVAGAVAVENHRPGPVVLVDHPPEFGQLARREHAHVEALVLRRPEHDRRVIAVAPHPPFEVLPAARHELGMFGHQHLPTRVDGTLVDHEHPQLVAHVEHVGRRRAGVESQHVAVGRLVTLDHAEAASRVDIIPAFSE